MFAFSPRFAITPILCTQHKVRWPRYAPFVLLGAFLLISTGCTSFTDYVNNGFKVGPNYRKPPAPVADDWIDSKSKGVNVATQDLRGWWRAFNDPKLDALIEEAYRQNLTLRSAGTRILAARAQRNIAVGNLFPQTQQAFGDYRHFQASDNTPSPPRRRFFNDTAVGVNLAWEIDFWGRFRRGVESANAD